MKSEIYSSEQILTVTPSMALQFLFCPKFVYFCHCLKIPEHEEQRYKVQLGRETHDNRERENTEYLRKKLGVIEKKTSVYLSSPESRVRGIIDEVLTLQDGTMAPLEYKFAEYRPFIFRTHKFQLVMQAQLIKDHYKVPVTKAFLVYIRSQSRLVELELKSQDFITMGKMISNILEIIENETYPFSARNSNKCIDCCYKNICV